MESDFSFFGFHHIVDDGQVLVITIHPGDDVVNIKKSGEWRYGDLFISRDGLYVESTAQRVYDVYYTWDAVSKIRMHDQKGLFYVDGETYVGRAGLFRRRVLYYPPHTRYVINNTDRLTSMTMCLFNMKVNLHM